MSRLRATLGVLLCITAGIAASVLAQGQSEPKKPSAAPAQPGTADRDPAAAPHRTPVFEYEIRIWKDGVPVIPPTKRKANPGEVSEIQTPEGTFEFRLRTKAPFGASDGEAQKLVDAMLQTDLEIREIQRQIDDLLKIGPQEQREAAKQQRIVDEFRADPVVIALTDEIELAHERRVRAKTITLPTYDPARRAAETTYEKLMTQYQQLWEVKYEDISARLNREKNLESLQGRQAALKAKQAKQIERLKELRPQRFESKPKP